jgi:uncharacterized protein
VIDYFDASAIVSIILDERDGGAVSRLIDETEATIVSEFGVGEASSAISRLVRMKAMSPDDGNHMVAYLDDWIADTADYTPVEDEDIMEATRLVRLFELKLRMPDALHLAIAMRLGIRLVTLDRNLAAAARAVGANVHNPADDSVDTKD